MSSPKTLRSRAQAVRAISAPTLQRRMTMPARLPTSPSPRAAADNHQPVTDHHHQEGRRV